MKTIEKPLQKPLVSIAAGEVNLYGELEVPAGASGLVIRRRSKSPGRVTSPQGSNPIEA